MDVHYAFKDGLNYWYDIKYMVIQVDSRKV